MKVSWGVILLLAMFSQLIAADASCRGCGAGKLMLQCDIYVARQGDLSRQHVCEEYAKIVDIDGASAKAAWYYLLAGKPERVVDAAQRALHQGQTFAAGYLAEAYAIFGKHEEAKKYMERFRTLKQQGSYIEKEIKTLRKIYPSADFSALKE